MQFQKRLNKKHQVYIWLGLLSFVCFVTGLVTMHTVMLKEEDDVAVSIFEYMFRAILLTAFSFVFSHTMKQIMTYYTQ